MALITCPECGKEVSDRAASCPHCGCPLETASAGAVPAASKKKLALFVCAAVVAVAAVVAITLSIKRSAQEAAAVAAHDEYIDTLVSARFLMLSGAADAEELYNLIHDVWYNTIYEKRDSDTYQYTHTGGKVNEDFNTSLSKLFAADSTKSAISSIEENQNDVADLMKLLQNPTEEFSICYDTVSNLYTAYQSMTDLAISPSGSLTTFTSDFNDCDNQFMALYKKLETQIPDKTGADDNS